ncbi:MAG: hypothetical protein OXG03_00650, partial [Gammaproteobacteria bacterium]|nr:hypothetical protein [Gammaproteobacteria bacterium]
MNPLRIAIFPVGQTWEASTADFVESEASGLDSMTREGESPPAQTPPPPPYIRFCRCLASPPETSRRRIRRGLLPTLPLLAVALSGLAPGTFAQTTLPVVNTDGSYTVENNWALKPPDLTAGDKFRLLFVTSTTRNADPTEISVYDTHVQDAAKNTGHTAIRPYSSAFRVLGSTATVDARFHTKTRSSDPGAPIYWLKGPVIGETMAEKEKRKVADDYADFYDGTWDSLALRFESGAVRPGASQAIFTGSNQDGTRHTNPLGGGSSDKVRAAVPTAGGNPISFTDNIGKDSARPFYGLSPVFVVGSGSFTPVTATLSPGFIYEGETETFTISGLPALSSSNITVRSASQAKSPTDFSVGTSNRNTPGKFTFKLTSKADSMAEGDEKILLEIYLTVANTNPIQIHRFLAEITLRDGPRPRVVATTPRRIGAETHKLSLTEGTTATYTVRLSTNPGTNVTVTVSPHEFKADGETLRANKTQKVGLSPTTLTFSASGANAWNAAQTVTVTSVEDDTDTNDEVVGIKHTVASGPYSGDHVVLDTVRVEVADDDVSDFAAILVSPRSISLTEGDTTQKNYTVVLASDPGASTTVNVNPSGGSVNVHQNASMVFDSTNWDMAQTVTVSAADDSNVDDEEIILGHWVQTSDTGHKYYRVQNYDLVVSVADDDKNRPTGVTVTPIRCDTTNIILVEDSAPFNRCDYRVRLNSDPGAGAIVTIAFSSSSSAVEVDTDPGNAGTRPSTLTFDSGDWNTEKLVALHAKSEDTNRNPRTAATISHTVSANPITNPYHNFTGFTRETHPAFNVVNDDVVDLSTPEMRMVDGEEEKFLLDSLEVGEGDTAVLEAGTTHLTLAPGVPAVSIPVRARTAGTTAQAGDYTLPGPISIAVAIALRASGTATIAFTDDNDDEPDEKVIVELGDLTQIGKVAIADNHATRPNHVEFTIRDDDPTTVTLAAAAASIDESGSGNKTDVTVTLGRALVAGESVVVPLSVSGATVATHYTLDLKSGSSLNTGVSISTASPHSAQNPAVTLSGAGAEVATLELVAVNNADTTARTVSIAYGTGIRAPTSAGMGGGITTSGSPTSVTIADDDAAPTPSLVISPPKVQAGSFDNNGTVALTLIPKHQTFLG